ncbi:MAG: hypothetical protein ABSE15_11060 [Candidatus Bathyarchaeia archaeon]
MKKIVSQGCEGCGRQEPCIRSYRRVSFGEQVFCPDGTVHLVDETSLA